MEKIQMLCYKGESWDSSLMKDRAVVDVSHMTAAEVATIADLQQEFFGRSIYIKRTEGGPNDKRQKLEKG